MDMLVIVVVVLFVAGHWMLGVITGYTRELMTAIPQIVG